MDKLFLHIINMSITSSYVILFVMIIRLLLKRFPKIFSYALWSVVLFRLISPVSIEGIISLIPVSRVVPQDLAYMTKPEINSGIAAIDNSVNNILPPAAPTASVNPMQIWLAIGKTVWLLGIFLLIVYSIFTTVKLYKKLRNARLIRDNIYKTDKFKTPFVFGIIRPKIYLPVNLSEIEKTYIIFHEQTHIRRFDHVIKLIYFLATCIHWFNPLVWIAFYLMSEDMELSCDESVIKKMGKDIKTEYSSSLLSMSTGRKILGGSPIAFGENNTEGRIKNVLSYKKPALWVLILVSIVIVIFIIGLITNPESNEASTGDRRPMIMVDGVLYLDTGKDVHYPYSVIHGEITSSVDQSEKPTEEGQSNFGNIGAGYAYFEDGIVVLLNNEWVLFEKEMIPEEVLVYLNNESAGMYEEVTVETKDNKKTFPWRNVTNPTYAPITYVADVDNDDEDEIIILLTIGYGTGVYASDIHILNIEDLTEIDIEDPVEAIKNTVTSSIVADGNKVNVEVNWDGKIIEKTYDKSYAGMWFEEVVFGSHVRYEVSNNRIFAKVTGAISPAGFPFTAVVEYDENLKVINIEVVDDEANIDTEDEVYSISYKKISEYLKEEYTNAFSPYYELLDFIITDYEEEVVDGNVEAVFHYKVVEKNYDRDPDTVEYIKEAKERGDKYYQTYYDEYLQPRESNFYFKAVIDENDYITLYTRNVAIESDEWHQVEMSDYIIKQPGEALEEQIEKILSVYMEVYTIFNGYIDKADEVIFDEDGGAYQEVISDKYKSADDIKILLESVFTPEYIDIKYNRLLESDNPFFKEIEGKLYIAVADGAIKPLSGSPIEQIYGFEEDSFSAVIKFGGGEVSQQSKSTFHFKKVNENWLIDNIEH